MKAPTQQFLQFKEIKEGLIILKNMAPRGLMMVSSINFDLKSEEEQKAIVYQFQNFLNSLDFSIQIIVQSRRLNITGYFDELKNLEKKEENELLQIQIKEYRSFTQKLLKEEAIMRKQFFVVVPFTLSELGATAGIAGVLSAAKVPKLSEEKLKRCREQLWQRMEFVAIGLKRCGLTAVPLTTAEIIELLWSWYHPQKAEVGYYPEIIPELIE